MQKKIVTIVVTYNGEQWIEKCLGGLKNSDVPIHIIVVDNASTDGTVEIIETKFQDVQLIQSFENLGFGKANNIGLKKSIEMDADYIFLLNQDAWIEPYAIGKLVNGFKESTGNYGLLSPLHYNGEGSCLDYNFSYYLNPIDTPEIVSDTFLGKQKKIYKTKFINAAAWMLSKECIRNVGFFDPLFPHYGEDWDYVNRVHHHGFSIGIVPEAVIYHDRDSSNYVLTRKRLHINKLIQVKNVGSSFSFNLLNFFVSSSTNIFKYLFFRQFTKLNDEIAATGITIAKYKSIKKSYNLSKKKGSYFK